MPIIDGKEVSPDHAIHQGLCPECGAKLSPQNALGHAQGHWGMDPNSPQLSAEGQRRFNLVGDFIEIAKPKPRMPIDQTVRAVSSDQKRPTNDLAVFGFCELWGLIFGLPPGEDLYHGGAVTLRMITFLAIGAAFAILGPTWPLVKSRFPRRFASGFVRAASDFRWWIVMLLLGLIIPSVLPDYTGTGTAKVITGTANIPSHSWEATISVPVSLPYTVRRLTADWNSGVHVTAKASGHFSVAFTDNASPAGGGELDWEVVPLLGSQSVAAATATDIADATPTATPTPKPWQSFASNGDAGQVFAHQIQTNPIPGPHTVSIVATESSHQFAHMLLAWLQGKWTIIEHGQPGAFIGQPSEYALDDGITIRAREGNVDAETLRLAFLLMGINVHRIILPDTDNRAYAIVEVGNMPADQR